jgi:hypothetical protein
MTKWGDSIRAYLAREDKDTSLPLYFVQDKDRGWFNATSDYEQMKDGKGDLPLLPSHYIRPKGDYTTHDRGHATRDGESHGFLRPKFEVVETDTGPDGGNAGRGMGRGLFSNTSDDDPPGGGLFGPLPDDPDEPRGLFR